MIQSLAYQIAEALPSFKAKLEERRVLIDALLKDGDSTSVRTLMSELLLQPLADIEDPRQSKDDPRLLIIIDALDEAEHNLKNELLECIAAKDFKEGLRPWCALLMLSRPEKVVRNKLKYLNTLELDTESHKEKNEKDVRNFLQFIWI